MKTNVYFKRTGNHLKCIVTYCVFLEYNIPSDRAIYDTSDSGLHLYLPEVFGIEDDATGFEGLRSV